MSTLTPYAIARAAGLNSERRSGHDLESERYGEPSHA